MTSQTASHHNVPTTNLTSLFSDIVSRADDPGSHTGGKVLKTVYKFRGEEMTLKTA